MIKMRLENIKQMKGILWRKMQKPPKTESVIPRFQVEELPKVFVELPPVDNLSIINVKYPLILPFTYANIKWNPVEKQLTYLVEEPNLTDWDKKYLEKISSSLIDLIEVRLSNIKTTPQATVYLEEQIKKVTKELSISMTPEQYTRIMYYIFRNFIGVNEIEPLLRDPWLEDIGCDGIKIPIYVVHRKYGSIKTNIVFNTPEELRSFVIKLAERCGKYVSYAEPIMDGTLPDGSRVSATLAGDVATRGPTFSIRKFSEHPFSPIDQIEFNTVSSTVMAYFWYLVESGISLLIAGGVATGKTSFLNSICMFIPPEAKIVSIEDTRELRLPHENWIPQVTRLGFGMPLASGEKYGEITLFDLLKGSFRQNPDYTIIGEVRGKEAYVMFQGMSSGHPCMSTFHAGSVDAVIKRLTTPPIELSPSLVETLDAIVIMIHAKEKGKSARRVRTVDEMISIKHDVFEPETFKVVEWNPAEDSFKFDKNSFLMKKIAHNKGTTIEEIWKEIAKRRAILDWMIKKGIKNFADVRKVINEYYKNPEKILNEVKNIIPIEDTPLQKEQKPEIEKKEEPKVENEQPKTEEVKEEPKPEEKKEPPKEDITTIFGFKIIAER